jgi:antitoxin ParD1/3/4
MIIELPPELEDLVQNKVASGCYQSASDVLKDALRLLEEQDSYTALHRDRIREQIAKGYDSLRAGKGVDGEAVFERIVRELDAIERKRA